MPAECHKSVSRYLREPAVMVCDSSRSRIRSRISVPALLALVATLGCVEPPEQISSSSTEGSTNPTTLSDSSNPTSTTSSPTTDPDSTTGSSGGGADTTGPQTTTAADTTSGVNSSGPGPVCGDGMIEGDEQCEGKDLGENPIECEALVEQPKIPFVSGNVSCDEECQLDVSGCSVTCGVDLGDNVCANTLEAFDECCDLQENCDGDKACEAGINCLATLPTADCPYPGGGNLDNLMNCLVTEGGTVFGQVDVQEQCFND